MDPGFDHVHGAGYHTSHPTGGGSRQDLQTQSNVSRSLPLNGHPVFLLVKSKLQSGEREIAENSRLVSIEKSKESLLADDRAQGIGGTTVVIPGVEERIVVASLKLHARLQDFRWDIDERRRKVGQET